MSVDPVAEAVSLIRRAESDEEARRIEVELLEETDKSPQPGDPEQPGDPTQ